MSNRDGRFLGQGVDGGHRVDALRSPPEKWAGTGTRPPSAAVHVLPRSSGAISALGEVVRCRAGLSG
jgi:hypothetical protein